MRVIVDTNVLISAALKQRTPPETAVFLAAANHLLLKSTATERELFLTLGRPRLLPLIRPMFVDWLHELMKVAEPVEVTERIVGCRDPKDDKFLELAVAGRADMIISGDADLLVFHPFRGIPIVTPAGFVGDRGEI